MIPLFKKTILTKTIFFAAADIFFVALSVWLAFLLRFDFNIPQQYAHYIYSTTALLIIFVLPIFYLQKLYSFSWAYVSANELISLFLATTAAFILFSIAIYIFNFSYFSGIPRSVILISYILVFTSCGFVRLAKRIYYSLASSVGTRLNGPRTLIVGAGDAGEQILRSIISSAKSSYNPVGFADDNPIKRGVVIHGLKVLGKISDIPSIVKTYNIKQLVIALPSAGSKEIRRAVELGKNAGVWKIKIAPPLSEIIRGEVSFKNLKDVEVEDLLGREKVSLDTRQIESFIKGKTVLITGAAGSIGSELSKQVAKFKPSLLILLDQDETGIFNISGELKNLFGEIKIKQLVADITDCKKMKTIFSNDKPNIVFHAAAYKHVPLMEMSPDEAVKNNILGTKNVAELSIEHGVEKMISISTDKAVNPTSVMGASKRVCEMVCQALNQKNQTKFISVRFGNVLNSRGSVIPIFKEQIRRGGPVQVTHPDMKRYFMLTSEACLLVMQAGAMGKGGEVFVLDMGQPVKIVDLAKDMIRISGLKPDKDIAIVFSGQRPGEKLFEEMLTAEEGTVATQNEKIFTAKLKNVEPEFLAKKLALLKDAAELSDKESILKIFSELVPTYHKD